MRIALAGDHAAVGHKQALRAHLEALGHAVVDYGTHTTASCDYPDFAAPACRALLAGAHDRAILICGSGIGISIAANKIAGIRCALAWNTDTARLAAEHNAAQALAFGARFVPLEQATQMVDAFLGAHFEERHRRRIDKIHDLEKSPC